jgi:hypothetical protein
MIRYQQKDTGRIISVDRLDFHRRAFFEGSGSYTRLPDEKPVDKAPLPDETPIDEAPLPPEEKPARKARRKKPESEPE